MASSKGSFLNTIKEFAKISGIYFASGLVNNALPFLLLPILTAYLVPEDYGNVALFTAYVSIIAAVTGASLNTYISKFFFDLPKVELAVKIGNSIAVLTLLSILASVLIALFNFAFPSILGLSTGWLLVAVLNSFSYLVFNMLLTVVRNSKRAIFFGVQQVGNTAINTGLTLFLVVNLTLGWQGRIIGIAGANIIFACFAIIYLWKQSFLSFNLRRKEIKDALSFVRHLLPNSLQSVVISRIGLLFLIVFLNKSTLGVYAVAYQIAYVVMIITITLNLTWTPLLFEELSKKNEMDKLHIVRMFYLHIGVVVLAVIFVNALAGVVLQIMTTEEYFGANEYILPLTMGMLIAGVGHFIMPILVSRNENRFLSRFSILSIGVMIILNYLLTMTFGAVGVAYAFLLSHLFLTVGMFWKSNRSLSLPWVKSLKFS